jgi:Putative DNA-binding domain
MTRAADPEAVEALRQRELLAALAAPRGDAAASPGLRAYRANAHASAERALATACPTLRALLGAEDFAQLAREFWHADPPRRGDLGEWGAALPGWIEAHRGLAEWPYLADCARLDLALHRCERAADALLDAASLALLADSELARLHLRLLPGVQVLASRWPLASIHAAHAGGDEPGFAAVRERLQAGQGEAVVVARDGWRGVVHRIDAPGLAFMQAVARGADLAQAFDAAGEAFDFAAWLADALRCHWLKEVAAAGA